MYSLCLICIVCRFVAKTQNKPTSKRERQNRQQKMLYHQSDYFNQINWKSILYVRFFFPILQKSSVISLDSVFIKHVITSAILCRLWNFVIENISQVVLGGDSESLQADKKNQNKKKSSHIKSRCNKKR